MSALPILTSLLAVVWLGGPGEVPKTSRIEVSNAGFEAGPEGWDLPANAAVVSDVAHSGERSARLTVQDPLTEPVYITRQIPVVGGAHYRARCWVKTAGVVEKPGRMESVGAGLIVEWADPNGRWFASGVYATGLYGDQDWTLREAQPLRAPEEAGFAAIYLALRGAGTAWFDDFELVRVHHALTLQSPPSGQPIRDNTPTLQWLDDPAVLKFTVELSPDPAFPAEATRRLEVGQPAVTIAEPLPPGRWYWRVTASGYDPSEVWSFDQTAALDQDTTAPVILAGPTRVTRPDEPVRFRIREAGPGLTVQARLGDQVLPVQVEALSKGEVEAILAPPWEAGLNRLTITATDQAGNAEARTVPVVCRPAPDRPITISPEGFYLDAGQRIFPLGIYQVSPAAMPAVKQAGFEVVHTYQFEDSADDEAARAYLDAAAAAGLRVFLGFDRGLSSGRGLVQGNVEHLIQRVAALCDHPGLFCWYLFDEPEVPQQYIAPRTLNGYADLIRRLDPYHAVVVTTWGPRMALYRPSFDTHWTQAYTTPAGVVAQIEEHRRLLGPETPITLLVHCFDREQTEGFRKGRPMDPSRFQPDAAWLRAAAYAGVTQGVNGLWWWWYADQAEDWLTVADVPEVWQALSRWIQELQELEPCLVHPNRAATGSLEVPDGRVTWWRKEVDGESTLIAVNTTERAVQVAIPATGEGPVSVLFEDRQVQRRAGVLTDDFPRYGVHVYRWREGP